jgi:hypothetical protein
MTTAFCGIFGEDFSTYCLLCGIDDSEPTMTIQAFADILISGGVDGLAKSQITRRRTTHAKAS